MATDPPAPLNLDPNAVPPTADPVGEVEMRVRGTTGLRRNGGYIDEEFHRHLRNRRARIEMYTEMRDNSSVHGGVMLRLKTVLRRVGTRVQPANASDRAQMLAQFLDECLRDMAHTWDGFQTEFCSIFPFGFAAFEKCFKVRGGETDDKSTSSKHSDGRIGWSKWSIRPPDTIDRWAFAPDGEPVGFWQIPLPSFAQVFIPLSKVLLFHLDHYKENPEGYSLFRSSYRDYYFAKRIEEDEAIGLSKDLTGWLLLYVPPDYLDEGAPQWKKNLLEDMKLQITEARVDSKGGMIVPAKTNRDGNPSGWDVDRLAAAGSRQFDTDAILARKRRSMAAAMMCEFMEMSGGTGNNLMHIDKSTWLLNALDAVMDMQSDVINADAIPQLMRINGFDDRENWPTVGHTAVRQEDMMELAAFLEKAVASGAVTPGPELEEYVRDRAKLPPIPEQDAAPSGVPNVPLAIQYLSLALERATAAGDAALSADIRAKISQMLDSLGKPAGDNPIGSM